MNIFVILILFYVHQIQMKMMNPIYSLVCYAMYCMLLGLHLPSTHYGRFASLQDKYINILLVISYVVCKLVCKLVCKQVHTCIIHTQWSQKYVDEKKRSNELLSKMNSNIESIKMSLSKAEDNIQIQAEHIVSYLLFYNNHLWTILSFIIVCVFF